MLLLFLFLPYKRLWNRYKIKLKGFISLYTLRVGKKEKKKLFQRCPIFIWDDLKKREHCGLKLKPNCLLYMCSYSIYEP